jgi:hypothetical protein
MAEPTQRVERIDGAQSADRPRTDKPQYHDEPERKRYDFIDRLIARRRLPAMVIQPRPLSRFEPPTLSEAGPPPGLRLSRTPVAGPSLTEPATALPPAPSIHTDTSGAADAALGAAASALTSPSRRTAPGDQRSTAGREQTTPGPPGQAAQHLKTEAEAPDQAARRQRTGDDRRPLIPDNEVPILTRPPVPVSQPADRTSAPFSPSPRTPADQMQINPAPRVTATTGGDPAPPTATRQPYPTAAPPRREPHRPASDQGATRQSAAPESIRTAATPVASSVAPVPGPAAPPSRVAERQAPTPTDIIPAPGGAPEGRALVLQPEVKVMRYPPPAPPPAPDNAGDRGAPTLRTPESGLPRGTTPPLTPRETREPSGARPKAAPPTTVHVTIGRVEVRAVSPAPVQEQAAARAAPQHTTTPVMTLETYLRLREQGGRS